MNLALSKVTLPSLVSWKPTFAGEPSAPTALETASSSWPPSEVTE